MSAGIENTPRTENEMSKAQVKILEPVSSRVVNTTKGQRTIYSQKAELETEAMRIQVEVEVDGPNFGHPVGAVKDWDVVADLVPGRYGIELARRMTLREANAARSPVRAAASA
jgi:hypothetical protein